MTTPLERADQLRSYREAAGRYLSQAVQSLRTGEADKAGELLWGALAGAANALAVLRLGRPLRSHEEVRRLLRQLAHEDSELEQVRQRGEQLHANFYHRFLDLSDLLEIAPANEAGVYRLLAMTSPP